MNVQAEVSLYPLRTDRLGEAVDRFAGELRGAGLTVRTGSMSSTLAGDAEEVFAALGRAFQRAAEAHEVVLVVKVSNACPADAAGRGNGKAGSA